MCLKKYKLKLCHLVRLCTYSLEDVRFAIYEDVEEIVTYVSECSLQRQSNEGNLSSNRLLTTSGICAKGVGILANINGIYVSCKSVDPSHYTDSRCPSTLCREDTVFGTQV